MASVLRASDEAAKEAGADKSRLCLTDNEIFGNIYIYNVAGHETSAVTLAYTIALLACFPEWQDWASLELDVVFGEREVCETDYEQAYPKLNRCLALMYDTLRIYAPLNGIPRFTGSTPQRLYIGPETYTIPPKTAVYVNNAGIQCNRAHWGADTLQWRPCRWICDDGPTENLDTSLEKSYLAWASGPRACPGRKFSQVEIVAALACLLKRHRVVPVLEAGETEEGARRLLLEVVGDSDMALSLKINRPERLRVRWIRDCERD